MFGGFASAAFCACAFQGSWLPMSLAIGSSANKRNASMPHRKSRSAARPPLTIGADALPSADLSYSVCATPSSVRCQDSSIKALTQREAEPIR